MDAGENHLSQVQYLQDVKQKVDQFLELGHLIGRASVVKRVTSALLVPGSFVFVYGGRSVGKSLLAKEIIRRLAVSPVGPRGDRTVGVVAIDGRGEPNVMAAMRNAVARDSEVAAGKVFDFLGAQKWQNVTFNLQELNMSKSRTIHDTVEDIARYKPENVFHKVLVLD